jgi:hypothetical protein
MFPSFNVRFIIFQHYRIPRESLLNRLSDVTLDGDYETAFTTPEQQLGKQSDNELFTRETVEIVSFYVESVHCAAL